MELSLLGTLKEKLINNKVLADVQTYFLDHFGENQQFMDLGEEYSDPFLEGILRQVARQLQGRAVTVDNVLLLRLPEEGFIHGHCAIDGRMGALLYFEDIRQGLLSVIWSLSPPETKFVRFSARPLPQVGPPLPN